MTTNPLAALLLAAVPFTASASTLTLRILGQESLPPKWILREGQPTGVCPDILAALEKAEPRLRFIGKSDFRSMLVIEHGLQAGTVDVACALLDTGHRRAIARPLGKPLYIVRQRLAAAAGDTAVVENLEDLVRLKPLVNTSRGAAYIGQLRSLGIDVDDSTGDNVVNLKKILAGHGRFFYMNEETLSWLIRDHKLQDRIKLMPAVLREDPVYFWVGKKAPAGALHMVEGALEKLQASGELARIYERWTRP